MAKTIRQSCFQAGLKCRRAFKLAQEQKDREPSKAMIDGLVFEGFVFCYETEETKKYSYNKNGSIKASVIELEALAEKIRPLFGTGEHHKRLYVEMNGFTLSGEPDFIGEFNPNNQRAIVDLKLTKDIAKIWNYKQTKEDYFQAVSYTYMHLALTGEKLPFYYLVVGHNSFNEPVYRIIEMIVTDEDLEWFRRLAYTLYNDELLIPDTSQCLGFGKFDPQCRYLEDCDHGRMMLGGTETITFSQLQCDFELDEIENEQAKFDTVKKRKSKIYDPKMDVDEKAEESDLDAIFGKMQALTYMDEEFKTDEPIKCRSCFKNTITKGINACPKCHIEIKMI